VGVVTVRYSERAELWQRIANLSSRVWPEYNLHADATNRYWGRLYDDFPDFQFVLYDDERDEVLAEGHTIPCTWDGTAAGLGPGIDHTIAAAFALREAGGAANALSALAAEVLPERRERGLSSVMLRAMAGVAVSAGLEHLVAPVRPSWKERYPLAPIERYVHWTGRDGQPFDPWIRVHLRMGGRIVAPIPHSMRITGSVADWESWTAMEYPESGEYVFPHGLATLLVDREADTGSYWEPNVWIAHTAAQSVQG
jgi:GNAT superfamily N-acetyltransferase